MGYTHAWILKDTTQDLKVPQIAQDIRSIVSASEMNIVNRWMQPHTEPEITDSNICFNGVPGDGYEPFFYPPNPEWQTQTKEVFDFCKTQKLPYDVVVCAALLAIKHHLDDQVTVSSNGKFTNPEWQAAYHLYRRSLRRELPEQFRIYEHKQTPRPEGRPEGKLTPTH